MIGTLIVEPAKPGVRRHLDAEPLGEKPHQLATLALSGLCAPIRSGYGAIARPVPVIVQTGRDAPRWR